MRGKDLWFNESGRAAWVARALVEDGVRAYWSCRHPHVVSVLEENASTRREVRTVTRIWGYDPAWEGCERISQGDRA